MPWVWPLPNQNALISLTLFRPLAPILGVVDNAGKENFLTGLQAERVLGVESLPVSGQRRSPLVWMGVALSATGRAFKNLGAGCWVCGFPAVGQGKELLQRGNLADAPSLQTALAELGQVGPVSSGLYFNFHYNDPEATCDRVYVLDAEGGRLHGFAFPRSALAPAKLK